MVLGLMQWLSGIEITGGRKDKMSIFNLFNKHKSLEKEIEQKEKLCELQAHLNVLTAEEKLIESTDKITSIPEVIPASYELLESK